MKALILAGGLGTRLSTVVPGLPKPIAEVSGRPFLEHLLDYWIDRHVDEFYLSICHLADKIRGHFKEGYRGCKIHFIEEPSPLGTGGGVLYCLDQIADKEEDILVLNGDTYAEVDINKMLSFHREKKSMLTLALREVEQNDRYSGVVLNQNFQIESFRKRETRSSHLLINAGIYLLKPKIMFDSKFHVGEIFSIEDDFFPEIIEKKSIYGFITHGKFIDIGIPEDYQRAQTFFSYANESDS